MTSPKVGDRVKVTIEGTIVERWAEAGIEKASIRLTEGEGWAPTLPVDGSRNVSVEVIPPPEPTNWPPQQGDLWQLSGTTYFVHGDGWGCQFVISSSGGREKRIGEWIEWALNWRGQHPTLGFALIARDGKPA